MLDSLRKMLGVAPPAPPPRPLRIARPLAADFAPVAPGPHLRTPMRPEDLVLSPAGDAWLLSLSRRVRPLELARQFPRIVNRFALVWPDPVLTEAYFDSLLVDRRGGRRGFPREVLTDILRMHEYFVQRQSGGQYRGLVDSVRRDAWARFNPR